MTHVYEFECQRCRVALPSVVLTEEEYAYRDHVMLAASRMCQPCVDALNAFHATLRSKLPVSLSEAIRQGALLRPQAFKYVGTISEDGGSCALGAALEYVCSPSIDLRLAYKVNFMNEYVEFMKLFPIFDTPEPRCWCPACYRNGSLSATMVHVNDDHHWSREKIADWIEMLEQGRSPEDVLKFGGAWPEWVP